MDYDYFDGQPLSHHDFQSLVDLLQYLKKKNFTHEFVAKEDSIFDDSSNRSYRSEELKIAGTYRFEGDTNPANDSELLAIVAEDGVKGTLIVPHGAKVGQNDLLIRKIEFLK